MKKLLVLFLCLSISSGFAQVVLENNPTSLKWNQVNSANFRIIFPEGFDVQAQRMANTLEHIRSAESRSMGKEPRKISVVLQNQSAISNGFVSMFPRRSEFYAMPSQNYNFVGTNDWLNLLAAHEFRHIVQYQHANRGFNRILFYLFGAPTLAGMAHISAPDWFWEGDAVATETSFTPSGRGKIPHFNLIFRTNFVEGKTFNYHKQHLRSYKHLIPDHYVLGFNMVSYLRRRTNDPDIWEKITKRSWSVPFVPFAFSRAIKNKTGMNVTKLYRAMATDLKDEWSKEVASLKLTPFETMNKRQNNAYTDFLYPQPLADGSVLAMKQGIGDIQQFVIVKDGNESKVFTPGFVNDPGMLSAAEPVVVWNEFGFDPRWQVKNFSLIKAYDWENGEQIVVSHKKARYASAALSPDKKSVATVRTDENYNHALTVLDFPSGRVRKEFANPDNKFYSMPRWSADGKTIVALKLNDTGKTITIVDVESGVEKDVLPFSHENIGHPVLYDNYVVFSSGTTGIDNLFAIDLTSGKRSQITTSKYGAYNPMLSPDGSYLYYNEQTANGLDIVRVPFQPNNWFEVKSSEQQSNMYSHLVEQEGNPELFANIPQNKYPVKKYSKFGHLINPYSWGLLVQNDLSRIDVGLSSQDILSTTSLSAGYTYDLDESTGFWRVGLSYQGFFPIIDFNFTQGERSVEEDFSTTVINKGQSSIVTDTYEFKWVEQNINAGIRIPLTLTRSKYSTAMQLGYSVGATKVSEFENGFNTSRFFPAVIEDGVVKEGYFLIDYQTGGTMIYNQASLSLSHLLKRSRRDIFSPWGQTVEVNYFGTPFGGDFNGGLFSAIGSLYFPGLFKHHSLYGYIAYQQTMLDKTLGENDYLFRNTVPLPRGINDYVARFRNITTSSINYMLPVWYPDIAIGPVLNIQRVRLNLFSDYAFGESTIFQDQNEQYWSVGGEIMFDINLFRFAPQLDIGFRYTQGIEPNITNYEMVIGTFNF